MVLSHSLFNCFSKNQLINLFKSSKYNINAYEKGQIVHLQNEICLAMDIILDGQISVQKIDKDGNILKIIVLTRGDILGANLIFSSRNSYPMTIISESKSVVLQIYKESILSFCKENTSFMAGMMSTISDKTLVLTDKIDAISLKTIRQRINDFLKYEYHIQRSNKIKLNITKKELAERLGVQRSSLSRELNKMRSDGLVEYDSRSITIKDYKYYNLR